jgi:hypothetical protein
MERLSVSALAEVLGSNRVSVTRDVNKLKQFGSGRPGRKGRRGEPSPHRSIQRLRLAFAASVHTPTFSASSMSDSSSSADVLIVSFKKL